MATIIDITRPLGAATPTWPGDAPFELAWTSPPGTGSASVSRLSLSPHLGTHLDAPLHLEAGGADAASVDLGACIGACLVVRVGRREGAIEPDELPAGWSTAERLLLATAAWPAATPLPERFPAPSPSLAAALIASGVRLVGIDTPSIDPPEAEDLPAHRALLAAGVVVVEGLDLAGVEPGRYTLMAAPLRLVGVEASPVRAVLLDAGES